MNSKIPLRHEVSFLLEHAKELRLSKAARVRLEWFAYAAAHDGNVSLTCRYFGISRSTFLRWAERFCANDPSTLEERSRRPHRVRQSDIDDVVIERIHEEHNRSPFAGKRRLSKILEERYGIRVSPSTVGRIIAHKEPKQKNTERRGGIFGWGLTINFSSPSDTDFPFFGS